MKITSEQVAKLANVSRSTVSRVINHYPNVPEETRRKVMDVIEKYGYEPNSFARVLAGKSNTEIALCISDYNIDKKRWRGMGSMYFMRLIAELVTQSREYGHTLSIVIVSSEADYSKIENMFLNREVCGGIFVGFEFQMNEIHRMAEKGFPMVIIDPSRDMEDIENVRTIYSENEAGAFSAVTYLLEKGHRRIAHIAGDSRLSSRDRQKGYCRAMEAAGLGADAWMIERGGFDADAAYDAAVRLIRDRQATAIFAANDLMAIAAARAAADLNRKIPEEISVIGFDYTPFYEDLGIHLTTVEISVQEIAAVAVRAVLNLEKRKTILCKAKLRKGETA